MMQTECNLRIERDVLTFKEIESLSSRALHYSETSFENKLKTTGSI